MYLFNQCQQAWVNLLAAKLRSFLAVLGILVGTAAVVALLSCGQLATEKALQQFKALGTDLLAISFYQKAEDNQNSGQNFIPLSALYQFPQKIPAIKKIAPYASTYQTLSYEGNILNGSIIGADEKLADIIKIKLAMGRFVSFLHSYEKVCVIGNNLWEQIKETTSDNPLGKQLRIGENLYTIIGVAQPWKENGFFNEDINTAVIIPVGGMALISQDTAVNNAIMLLRSDSNIEIISEQLKSIVHKEAPKLTVFIRSAKQIIASMESQGRIFTLLLAIIGSISLLVGGIGVMNVMLVSVSERKKEIGLRKAVGAKNNEIQRLFLVESVMLSLVGGFLGICVGLIFTAIIAYFNQWHFTFYLLPPLAGFGVSVVTGVFFGFYPARRAALLEPMETLRATI
ncbi:ABC transporter permease (plasmid) [Legionella adelaidensis]|uniref:ABC transporter permease n=1 Tax=Legionella adelaidensis TaxID=45056 RepID=A0A0W0R0K9_9GAMM|nr:ABC transporter permease [Legionella adelaidensis]KTC64640.1 ABC transporter permease [Legionella adelaidensis]VEH86108.1 ABC transporter permease [Legionella adelaidensis]